MARKFIDTNPLSLNKLIQTLYIQQQILMRNIIVFVSVISTFIQAQYLPEKTYTLYTSFDSIEENVVWMETTADSRYLNIVGFSKSGEQQQEAYDTFTWQPINNQLIFSPEPVTLRIFFLNPSNQSCLLFFGKDNRLVLRIFSEFYQSYTEQEIYRLEDQNITNFAVSSDGSMWGIGHKANGLYYGKINQPGVASLLEPIDGTEIYQNFIFRPNSNQLILSAASKINQDQSNLLKYDMQTKQLTVLSNVPHYPSYVFLPSGKLLIIKYNFKNHCIISQIDVDTGQINNEDFGFNICKLEVRGSIVKIVVSQTNERYYFLNQKEFKSDNYFFSQKSGNGITLTSKLKTGVFNFVFQKENKITQIKVYKMCNVDGFFYNQVNYQCQLCHQSCRTCIYRADTCLYCKDEGYQFDEKTYSCLKKQNMGNDDWILIVLAILMCVLVIVVVIIFMKRRHNKKKKNLRSSMLSQNMQTLDEYQILH